MEKLGSYQEAIEVIQKMLSRKGGWGAAEPALQAAIKRIRQAEIALISGKFEGTNEDYNRTIMEHEL